MSLEVVAASDGGQEFGAPVAAPSALKLDRDRFVAFAFASADILLEVNGDGKILFADGATIGVMGQKPEKLVGQAVTMLVVPEDKAMLRDLLVEGTPARRFGRLKVRFKSEDGRVYPFVMAGYRLPDMGNHWFLTLSLARQDIEPEDLGRRDLKTGLLKAQAFSVAAAAALQNAEHVKISLLDVPELPRLLEGAKKEAAEALLDEICLYLRQQSYGGDLAGVMDDGAGFMLMQPADQTPGDVAEAIAGMAAKHFGAETVVNGSDVMLDGVQLTERDCAHALQYTINRFAESKGEAFTISSLAEGYQAMLDETVKRISAFHHTVSHQAFQIALQPIVDLRNKRVHHFEVLTRLEDQSAFANPFDFITFGENAGVIGEFDLAMCQRTFDLLEEYAQKGKRPLLSVNLSGFSLGSDLFKDTLLEMLKIYNGIRHQVIFEVTESAKIMDLPQANKFLQVLRKEGNLCCLDDFGVGESSFDYIRHLEVDFVKIDGSYVRESLATPRGKHLLKAMVALCQDMHMKTIGEMVEDENVSQYLSSIGVQMGQGYHYGKPTTEFEPMLMSLQNQAIPATGAHDPSRARKVPKLWRTLYAS